MHIRKNIIAVSATFLCLASQGQAQDLTNKLTPDETAASYDLLFNGTNFTNWHGYNGAAVNEGVWKVRTNAPLGPRIENAQGTVQYILTDKQYKNFDFKADVQTPANGNSGIFMRYEEISSGPFDKRSGPEFQICGPNAASNDCNPGIYSFGACYNMFAVTSSLRTTWYNPPGEWNQIRIVAYDSNYVHYGNGKKLLEYKIGTAAFEAAYAASKYADDGNNGRYYHIHPGRFMLQHHGEYGISFRNMKAKELDTHPFRREFLNGRWPDTLSQAFAFGGPSVPVSPVSKASAQNISVAAAGAGLTLLNVHPMHDSFEALGVDGRKINFRKTAEGSYLLNRADAQPGIVIVRVRMDGQQQSKAIWLQ